MNYKLKFNFNFNKSLVILILLFGLIAVSASFRKSVTITLPENKDFLQIPGVGWQTFGKTADKDKTMAFLRFKSGCAYYRFYWNVLEPQEGQYAFDMLDTIIKHCRKNNQALALRFMCENPWGEGLPKWLIDKGIKRTYSQCPQEGAHWVPDMSDSLFQFYHNRMVRAFGKRYDGNPELALMDIGSIGLWGEGHIYCDSTLMPDRAIRKAITDLYYEAFPSTPLTGLVDDKINVLYANSKGRSAWRGDCWGNGEVPGRSWNHHTSSYWPMNKLMPEGWKRGTVALETCGTFGSYQTTPKITVDDAIAWHTTFVQNKSVKVPEVWIPDIERLVMKLGFRLTLRNLTYLDEVPRGSSIPVTMNWENLGIAPPYRDHRIAFRLKDKNGIENAVEITDISIFGWLPGEKRVSFKYKLPNDVEKGDYMLEMGVVFHSAIDHTIPIANTGKTSDGWYSIGKLKVL